MHPAARLSETGSTCLHFDGSIGSMACKNLACSGFCQQKVQPSPVQSHFSTLEVTLFTYDLSWQQPWILGGKRATCGAGSNAWKGDS